MRTPAALCRIVPETCSDDAAAMAQPLAVALHALRRSGAQPGQSIAVIGAGGIGSFLIGAAAASGAGELIAVDIDDGAARCGTRLGASHTVNAGREDAVEAIRAVTGSGADVVLEASGAPRSPGVAIAAAKRGGTVLIVGLQAEPVALDLFSAAIREVDLKTTLAHVCDEDLAAAVEMLDTTEFAHAAFGALIALSEIVPRGLVPLADGSREWQARRGRGRMKVAFLGLGRMGVAMAHNLAQGRTCSRRSGTAATARPAGAPMPACASPPRRPTPAGGADVVILMLADGTSTRAVGAEALPAMAAGSRARRHGHERARRRARHRAPRAPSAASASSTRPSRAASRSPTAATLTALVGGSAEDVEKVRPALAAMTRAQHHLGDVGGGATVKLALAR